ncbi:MAG TPA: hypothetical protein VK680_15110 [Solirubrobacteraceae bacterium]|nr:hypothetical protein [Solirubrobacteraceae bacterium]
MRAVRVVQVTLAVGVALLIGVIAYTLSRSPPRVLRAGVAPNVVLSPLAGSGAACQIDEVLPAHTSAIRLSIVAYIGARIRLTAYSGSQLLTGGSRGPDWTGTSVTVPVKPLSRTVSNVRLCVDIGPNSEYVYLFGRETPPAEAMVVPTGGRLSGRLDISYLGAGRRSWWSRALEVARHMGLGRAFSGTWIVLLIATLVGVVGILAGRLTLRELP